MCCTTAKQDAERVKRIHKTQTKPARDWPSQPGTALAQLAIGVTCAKDWRRGYCQMMQAL